MADLKYTPLRHDHQEVLERAQRRKGFAEAYEALGPEYEVMALLLKARTKAGLTQDAVAQRMGTTKSAVCRLESAHRHAPSLTTLRKYAQAVGCDLKVTLVPHK